LYDVESRLLLADREQRLLVGATLDLGQKIREFLVGSQSYAFFFSLVRVVRELRPPSQARARPGRAHLSKTPTSRKRTGNKARHRSYHAVYRDILLDQRAGSR
jgi:hypothetical protein